MVDVEILRKPAGRRPATRVSGCLNHSRAGVAANLLYLRTSVLRRRSRAYAVRPFALAEKPACRAEGAVRPVAEGVAGMCSANMRLRR